MTAWPFPSKDFQHPKPGERVPVDYEDALL